MRSRVDMPCALLALLTVGAASAAATAADRPTTKSAALADTHAAAACERSAVRASERDLRDCIRGVVAAADEAQPRVRAFSGVQYPSGDCWSTEAVKQAWVRLCTDLNDVATAHHSVVSTKVCSGEMVEMAIRPRSGASPGPKSKAPSGGGGPFYVVSAVAVVRPGLKCPVVALQSSAYRVEKEGGVNVLKSDALSEHLYLAIQEAISSVVSPEPKPKSEGRRE
jgi:hypothetical protein